jgi:hypothetical protein
MARNARMILVREMLVAEADVLVMDNPPVHSPLPFSTREKGSMRKTFFTTTGAFHSPAAGYFLSGSKIFEI